MSAALKWPPVRYSQTQLGATTNAAGQTSPGGLDLTTPSLRLPPGALSDGLNFECAPSGGYARIQGYERTDGRAAPSAAVYGIIQVASFTNVPAVGLVVTQAVSGATGTIIAVFTGTAPYLAVTRVTGTFDSTNALTVPGPIAVGTATTLSTFLDAKTKAQYTALAADVYRALIGAVPGSGAVTGVVGMVFSGADNLYAFRPNAGNTATVLYKSSATGWTLVPFYNLIAFTAGTTTLPTTPGSPAYTIVAGENVVVAAPLTVQNAGGIIVQGSLKVVAASLVTSPQDGDTLTQGGVTATIKRVMWQAGSWSGSASGQFVITNPAGGNFTAGAAITTGATSVGVITLTAVQTAITLTVGGRFEFVKCNFSGQAVTRRIYGCDGINPAFEFDGDTLAPIKTGLTVDAPSHITFHKNYLFISYASSILYCGAGTPFKWTTTNGGGEIATGDTVNGMITLPGSQSTATLGVFLRSNTAFLYGTDPSTFNFVTFNTGIGGLPYGVQNLFDTFFFDTLGVVTLRTTQNYGNFLPSTLTKNILPFISQEGNKLVASAINRFKSQYRLFFNDGYGLYCTMTNQQYLGSIPVLFPNPVFSCDETTLVNGSEVTYFGSSDGLGYVYQLDKGTSFDGADLNAYATTAWDPIRSPRILKRFRAASLEVQGEGYAEIQFGYQLGYGNPQVEQSPLVAAPLNLSARAYWDSATWDQFVWDGSNLMPSDVDVTGTAENIQVLISSGSNYMSAYTLDSVIHHYSQRRGMRV